MNDYRLTIGLEIHAELKTRTKMFCNSRNDTNESNPNTNVCPVCLGYPGSLPAINEEAVRSVLRLGVAVRGVIADYTEFDRKNYFYPDIPKGYQISQYKHPLVQGGSLAGIALTRVHLEEDTAKSIHPSTTRPRLRPLDRARDKSGQVGASNENDCSLLDFNRAGVPLVELVTEPMIADPETAARFAREFQLLISPKYLNISSADMEKGEMRVEANISVSKDGGLGTKVEVKNLNSFKAMEKAIRHEARRQAELIERGGRVIQETRGWDEVKEETFPQRLKEESHDYRYFPDPDLPKLFLKEIEEFSEKALKATLPELPWQKRERYKKNFELKDDDIEIYVRDPEWGSLIEAAAAILKDKKLIQLASNYVTSDLKAPIPAESLAKVIRLIALGSISSRGAKDILKIIEAEGGEPELVAKERNLIQKSDVRELKLVVEKIIKENPEAVAEYQRGKFESLQFLIGQAMKSTKGSSNPQILKEIFTKIL